MIKLIILFFIIFSGYSFAQNDSTAYFVNGQVKLYGKLKDGKRIGNWTFFQETGDTNAILHYLGDSVKQGKIFFADTTGLIQNEFCFKKSNVENTLKENDFSVVEYSIYEDSLAHTIQNQIFFEDNYQTGVWKSYFSNGKLSMIINYKDGYLHGEWKQYYKNGKIMTEGYFKENAKIGTWKSYYKNGIPRTEENYLPEVLVFLPSGLSYEKIKIIGNKNKTLREDIASIIIDEFKDENKSFFELPRVIYLKDSLYKYWNEQGILIREEFWEKGILKETKEYDEEGNLIKE